MTRAAARRVTWLLSLLIAGACGQADNDAHDGDNAMGTVQSALCTQTTLSASTLGSMTIGSVVQLTANSASCATGETPEYRFLIRREGAATTYSELRPYNTQGQFALNTAGMAAGKYAVLVYARAIGRTVVRESNAAVELLIGPTCTAVTLSATPGSPQLPGTSIQLSMNPTCSEAAPAEHQVLVRPPGSGVYEALAPFGPSPFQWSTSNLPAGPYTLLVRTRAVGNTSISEASRSLSYRLGATCSQLDRVLSPTQAAAPGSDVTITATATCTQGAPADYQFSYRPGNSGAWQVIAAWGAGSEVWHTQGLTAGAYQLLLSARASDYPGPAQVSKTLSYQLGGACTAVTLGVSPKSPQLLGSTLVLTGSATCVGAPAEYRFLLKDSLSANFTEISPWGASATASLVTHGLLPGPQTLSVEARAKDSGLPKQVEATASYQLGHVCTGVTLRTSPASPEPAGTPIALSAAAKCAFGGIPEYRFSYRPVGGTWLAFRDWSAEANSRAPLNLPPGGYHLMVETRGQGHPGSPEAFRAISYTFGPACPEGYQSSGADSCVDIDECQVESGGCHALTPCFNTAGGFGCGPCPVGFDGDGASGCFDIDECANGNGGCHALTTCSNTQGGYQCSPCPAGYTGSGASSCVDINECASNNGGCDGLSQCTNNPGGFACGPCPAGYSGHGSEGCSDVDECADGGCDPLTACVNSVGSFACSPCPPGYSGSGQSGCSDVDECATGNGGCDALTQCSNSPGGFACGPCPSGYTGSGQNGCSDIDECASSNGGCDALTTCTNTTGGRSCGTCPPGYGGTGATGCIAPTPCTPNPCQNSGVCSSSGASFSCACSDGYGGSLCEIAPVSLLAAGDIGDCAVTNDTATGLLFDAHPGTIVPLGDIAYQSGTTAQFANCFHTVWGAHKARMRPVPGNHEYLTTGAAPYYAYFGAAAGDPTKGYYSYDLGTWHVVALNSNCSQVSCSAGSVQETWLRQDLAAHPSACTLVYFHHPRFSSGGEHGNATSMSAIWRALVDGGVEIALAGHDHNYERFAAQTDGAVASASGVVQFVVGTGGSNLRPMAPTIRPNSVARNATDHGILKLTLAAGAYSWAFVPIAGKSYTDSGTTTCH